MELNVQNNKSATTLRFAKVGDHNFRSVQRLKYKPKAIKKYNNCVSQAADKLISMNFRDESENLA